jgi:hypothetical protein
MYLKMKSINSRTILFIDGLLLSVLGFAQTINSFIGYHYAIGGYKILNQIAFASLGIFEMNFLLGLIGIFFTHASNHDKSIKFWLLSSCVLHTFIAISNIIFWKDVFVVNHAESTGKFITMYHFLFGIINLILARQNKPPLNREL